MLEIAFVTTAAASGPRDMDLAFPMNRDLFLCCLEFGVLAWFASRRCESTGVVRFKKGPAWQVAPHIYNIIAPWCIGLPVFLKTFNFSRRADDTMIKTEIGNTFSWELSAIRCEPSARRDLVVHSGALSAIALALQKACSFKGSI